MKFQFKMQAMDCVAHEMEAICFNLKNLIEIATLSKCILNEAKIDKLNNIADEIAILN